MQPLDGRQNPKGVGKNEMAHKNAWKKALLLEKKRTDIFPPFGLPLCALDLQNAAFAMEAKLTKTF